MPTESDEEVADLKERLIRSVLKVSELGLSNERLVTFLKLKAIQTGEARQRVTELEIKDLEKTRTIRSLKRRLRKRGEDDP